MASIAWPVRGSSGVNKIKLRPWYEDEELQRLREGSDAKGVERRRVQPRVCKSLMRRRC